MVITLSFRSCFKGNKSSVAPRQGVIKQVLMELINDTFASNTTTFSRGRGPAVSSAHLGLAYGRAQMRGLPFPGTQSPLMAPFWAGKVASHRAGPLQFWWSPLYSKHLCKEVSTWQGSVYSTGAFCRTSVGWVSARWASGRNSGERRRETRDQNERGCHAAYLCKPEWRLARDSFHTPLSELVTYDWGWAMLQEGESRLLRRALSTSSF